jgi:putative addiction module component (TIGR02574 family)
MCNLALKEGAAHALARTGSRCNVRVVSESLKKFGLDKLDVEQRLALIEEIWNSIDADESAAMQLSDAQRAELRARLLEDDVAPDDVVSWESIKRLAPPSGGK